LQDCFFNHPALIAVTVCAAVQPVVGK